jgi:hypothetical protein
MKKMTVNITCDAADGCSKPVVFEDARLAFGGREVTVDLCAEHGDDLTVLLAMLFEHGVPVKGSRKAPKKVAISKKSVQTSTASDADADVTPAKLDAAAVDKSAECNYCGEIKKSNAGLAQHLKYKHKQTLAKNASYRGAKKKGS